MDPITAFAFAVNILTVVDYSAKILSVASEIRGRGNTFTNLDRLLISDDLRASCAQLKALSIEPSTAANQALGQESASPPSLPSEVLARLADEAIAIATEIEDSLDQPHPGPESSVSVWRSLRHAVVAIWGERRLREKSERLESIRSELQFHVIVSIKAQVDVKALESSDQMGKLDQGTRQLIEAIMKDSKTIQIELDKRIQAVNQKLKEARQQLERQHQEAMSLAVHHHLEQMNAIKTLSDQSWQFQESIDISIVTRKISNALWFSKMSDRFDDIKPAYRKTFEWIFTSPRDKGLTTCTFMNWMEGNNGVYWVSGRAGSGKSTLMKFLAGDARADTAFEAWAGERTLITARHWFWSQAQDPLQKSRDGLLRAILHDIIRQCPEYAILIFPDQFVSGGDRWTDFPTSHDLTRAFARLLSTDNPPACVALMIDGLDEYEAPEEAHFELAEILKEAAMSKNLKVVVSSRPETPFETAFGDCDKLRLHELKRNDRQVYVADVLNRHWRTKFLVNEADDSEQARGSLDRLIECTVENSRGIFLWLKLVTTALAEEFNTCDSLTDLQDVLNKFPRGLEDLYRHMLQRIPEQRRIKGAQIIQLVRCSMTVSELKAQWISKRSPPPPMTAHALSVAHTDYKNVINRDRIPLRRYESEDAIRKVDHLLRSHCAGLLELKGYETKRETEADLCATTDRDLDDPEVVFLHKSVMEFIDRDDTQLHLLSIGAGVNDFNTYLSLMTCLLFKLKISDRHDASASQGHMHDHWPDIWYLVERFMRSAVFAETLDLRIVEALLESLDELLIRMFIDIETSLRDAVLKDQMPTSSAKFPFHWSICCPWDREDFNGVPHGRDYLVSRGGSMLFFAIENGLVRYPLEKLNQFEAGMLGEQGISLLISACRTTTVSPSFKGLIRPEIVTKLLRLGADPNRSCAGVDLNGQSFSTTPWGEMLHTLRGLRITSLEDARQLCDIMESFLENGADPAAQITWKKQEGQNSSRKKFHRTAREQIQDSFIDSFPAKKTSVPHDDEGTIPFVPFEELMSRNEFTRHFLISIEGRPKSAGAHTKDTRRRSEVHSHCFPSEGEVEIEEIAALGKSLIKLVERGIEQKLQTSAKRLSTIISCKLRSKSGSLGIRFTHLRRMKRRY